MDLIHSTENIFVALVVALALGYDDANGLDHLATGLHGYHSTN